MALYQFYALIRIYLNIILVVCEPRWELLSLAVWRRKGFQDAARRADERVAAVEPLDADDAADTEPWFELDCRGVSGDAWEDNN